MRWLTCALSLSVAVAAVCVPPATAAGPLSPEAAQAAFVLQPECRIELVANEPDVIDPVHIAFAPDGRLWVVEYTDYPHGPVEGERGKSRIRVLTDADGDGRFSDPVTFAEGLIFANGLMHWRDGVVVTTNGQVLFLRDTDGDGKCDDSQQWFTGFTVENPQLRCNHPTLGPDHKIYIANGLRGGKIVPGAQYPWPLPEQVEPLDISGRDFRFDPLTGDYEAISGNGQFGLTFDDWGNRFVCSNRNPCNHIVMEEESLKRAPYMRMAKVFEEASPAAENSKLYPISRTWTTSNLHANQFTAACGITIYRGDALPAHFYGNSFVCEPTGNLVHGDILTPAGITFTSQPEREGVEFLATQDEWFRPVNLAHGPDGALYVVDMYRAVIEHPQFVPDELKNRPDQLLGTDKGRIWRVIAATHQRAPRTKIDDRGANALVPLLAHPNSWQREQAQRLLVEAQDTSLGPDLIELLDDDNRRRGRLGAIRVLDSLGLLQPEHLFAGLPAPASSPETIMVIRNHFLAMARHRFPESAEFRELQRATKLWFQAHLRDDDSLPTSAPWLRIVLESLAEDQPFSLWSELSEQDVSPPLPIFRELGRSIGRKNSPGEVRNVLRAALLARENPSRQMQYTLAGLSEGLPGGRAAFHKSLDEFMNAERTAVNEFRVTEFNDFLRLSMLASNDPEDDRVHIVLCGLAKSADSLNLLTEALTSHSDGFQKDILEALSRRVEPEAAVAIAKVLPQMSVSNRNLAIPALQGNSFAIHLLLDLVENSQLPALAIDQGIAQRLMAHADPVIKEKAVRLLKSEPPADRVQVLAEYAGCLSLTSDPLRGREVFVKNCATCHQVGEIGVNVAPDISDSRTKTAEYLLTNILDPNRAIDNNFFSYTVVDTQGRVHTGVIASETGVAVMLKQPEGKTVSIARTDIEEMKNNGVSLMPVGLEKTIPAQDMADLISFIKNWRYLDGSVPAEVIR